MGAVAIRCFFMVNYGTLTVFNPLLINNIKFSPFNNELFLFLFPAICTCFIINIIINIIQEVMIKQ